MISRSSGLPCCGHASLPLTFPPARARVASLSNYPPLYAARQRHCRRAGQTDLRLCRRLEILPARQPSSRDRKSVIEGKSVSISVDLGGRSYIKKKKPTK